MVLSEEKRKEYIKRLLLSRMRLILNNGFYGLLLMHMNFSLDENIKTAATDGYRIYFGPKFLDELNDTELDFIMMHEILHVVLQHCMRGEDRNNEGFNIACDIVVNSIILSSNNGNKRSITLRKYGESMHLTPDGNEGESYTAEEVYEMLPAYLKRKKTEDKMGGFGIGRAGKNGSKTSGEGSALGRAGKEQIHAENGNSRWDDHTRWGIEEDDDTLRDVWVKNFEDACEAVSLRDASNQRGILPAFAERLYKELRKPQTDWRTILNEFVQEEIADYSFTPPDKRFNDNDFFLPDFNDKEEIVEDILFMIDTSGSMSDKMVAAAFSEVKGAIGQYDGKLKGWLGFFDAAIIEPVPFETVEEFKLIKPAGGGGTDFQIIFEYVQKHMGEKLPACIIILTDGFAPFPQEKLSMGIPVLWLINNDEVTPPWGKIARMV